MNSIILNQKINLLLWYPIIKLKELKEDQINSESIKFDYTKFEKFIKKNLLSDKFKDEIFSTIKLLCNISFLKFAPKELFEKVNQFLETSEKLNEFNKVFNFGLINFIISENSSLQKETINEIVEFLIEFQKQIATQNMKGSDKLLNSISEASNIVLLKRKHSLNWPIKFISKNISIYGIDDDSIKNYAQIIYPEDYDRVLYQTNYHIKTGTNYFIQKYRLQPKKNSKISWVEEHTVINREHDIILESLLIDITEKAEAEFNLALKTRALEVAANGIMICDISKAIIWVNSAFSLMTGYSEKEVIGKKVNEIKISENKEFDLEVIWKHLYAGLVFHGEFEFFHKFEKAYWEDLTITPIYDQNGDLNHFIWIMQDISKKKHTEEDKKKLDIERAHSQKIQSIGSLAAGIAHEINTPVQYIGDNISFLSDVFTDLTKFIFKLNEKNKSSEFETIFNKLCEEYDLEYITSEIPEAIMQAKTGIDRVSKIVKAMKEFSHPSSKLQQLADIGHLLENTITVARNEWKYFADININFKKQLTSIACYPDELNQVFLNLIINSAHAIEEKIELGVFEKGKIDIEIDTDEQYLIIKIIDNGIGIEESKLNKIFDPFFTTKEVGKGTGQGLAIAHSVIVEKHNGKIDVKSIPMKETCFKLMIPIVKQIRE